jgi:thiamine pyrophosphate-dependent acetolactate synthase large subunit-like protein
MLADIPAGLFEQRKSCWEVVSNVQQRHTNGQEYPGDDIYMSHLAEALYSVVSPDEMCLIRLPLSWKGSDLRATHPFSYLGQDGGGGVGSGPGQAVGSALALKETNYLPVALLGDGDFLMGSSGLWTAARYRLPLLIIVANNASFFNDEVHQERVSRARQRPVENKWIGIRIDDPLPDLSENAASLGATVVGGQVRSRAELVAKLQKAVEEVKSKQTVVVLDIQVRPDGYSAALEKAK